MTAAAGVSVTVRNDSRSDLDAFETWSAAVTTPPTTDPAAYAPVYTPIGSVAAGSSATFTSTRPLARIVLARQADEFPVKLLIADILEPPGPPVAVTDADEQLTQRGWDFYRSYASQPYAPVALQFTELILTNDDVTQLNARVARFFADNDYPGVDFGIFSMVGHWATNSLHAFPGTYWCYQPPDGTSSGFLLPQQAIGTITITSGTATYGPADGTAAPTPLALAASELASAGATSTSGVALTGIVRDLGWEGQPDQIVECFVGHLDGKSLIAQPYQQPTLPWYAVAYDLAFGAFTVTQIAMTIDMAAHVVTGIAGGVRWLNDNVGQLIAKIRGSADLAGETPGTESAGDVEPINVDIDVDVDVDIDIDVDVDVDIDIDIDVDVDVDIDIDVVFVDVDVDIDVDINIDVVTDVDIDVDVDVDVDIDVDTEVEVPPGTIRSLLTSLGRWIQTTGGPALLQMAAVNFAFYSAGKLLEVWRNADTTGMTGLQPRESTGLGLLLNYMLTESVPVSIRWTTFADYVGQSSADGPAVQIVVSAVLMAKAPAADAAVAAWRWDPSAERAAVAAMTAAGAADMSVAFRTLAGTTEKGKPLPVKVGAGVAMSYLKGRS